MSNDWKNYVLKDDATIGKIETISQWSVWKCQEKKWSEAPPVILRNILLSAMHCADPTQERFCIGEINKTDTNATLLSPFTTPGKDTYSLDLASNSRNQGRFTFSLKPVGKNYFGEAPDEQWKRIIYGSILHTGCKHLVYKQMRYIVVDDTAKDKDGNYFDDKVNNIHWQTGDSHAKGSRALMDLLKSAEYNPDILEDGEERPLQFRASIFNKWVGKGTIAYNPLLDRFGADLVIPISCLKGNKPKLGNHEGKVLMGLVFEAEERRAKPGWMLFQWFSFETLEQDGIITKMKEKCDRLSKAYNSIKDLAELLRIDQSEAEAELKEGTDELQSEAEYENLMINIIKVDLHGRLLLHPYIVKRVKERMQALWLNLAKAAGVRFYSVMCQPDESLAHYHVVLPDGRITGRRVFCAPDFEEGEYIVFCNPMRHWGDCQLWENKHEGNYINATGILAAPRLLLLNLGRDTDGDFMQLIKSSVYPNLRKAIADFTQSPLTEKFPKMGLTGNLQQIAIRSMNDLTGIVASLLARARAAGAEQTMLLIPAGGEQKTPKEMRIIDFLSQEIQIAVDSLKSAYPNNVPGLDAVKKFLDGLGNEGTAPWLKDFKDPACYRDRSCAVNPEARDTISRLVQTVNSYWKSPDLKIDSSPRVYEKVLFSNVEYAPEQLTFALEHRSKYRADMAKAIQWKEENDGSTQKIREVAEATKASKDRILETKKADGTLYSESSWVAAYWVAAHQAETGDAGLVFMIFPDEIMTELKNMTSDPARVVIVYGCQYGSWSAPATAPWNGHIVKVRAYIHEVSGGQKLAFEMMFPNAKSQFGWHHLGLVGEKYRPFVVIGETRTMKIYTSRVLKGQTTEVQLFDERMTPEEINEWRNFK